MRSRTPHTGPKPPDTARRLASAAPVGQIAASRHHAAARSRSPAAMSASAQATSARTTTEKTAVSENGAAILAPTGSGPGVCLPTPEQIAAEVRRRPIGALSPIFAATSASCLAIRWAGAAAPHHSLWRQPGQSGEGHPRSGISASRLILATRLARGVPAILWPLQHRPAVLIRGAQTPSPTLPRKRRRG
jgi:hypothetical protein